MWFILLQKPPILGLRSIVRTPFDGYIQVLVMLNFSFDGKIPGMAEVPG